MSKSKKNAETGTASPAPADAIKSGAGEFVEPAIVDGVQADHPAIDNNPRAGTSVEQNARDMNDPKNALPSDKAFVGEGIDPAPYGKAAK